ncbi:PAAR domain-containing protein [Variovorax sp. PAMC28562]|nr:PAAR domain-containing protein [Variovorax sp. PAMC28562]
MAERPIICVGDTTTHKGTVIEGFEGFDVYGRRASGVGHKVRCPICPGIHTIIEGAEERTVNGVRIALEGMLTSCGATLIALQSNARSEIGSNAAARIAFGLGTQAIAEDHDSKAPEKKYDQHFHVLDEGTGEPLRHRRYRLTVDGLTFEGVTDSDGKTQRVSAAHALSAELEVLPEGE